MRKLNWIIGKVKSKYQVRTQTFVVEISKYVAELKAFDGDNGNTLW